ncbi:hypothetical protein HN011_007770, partial [Eciton burchellii]
LSPKLSANILSKLCAKNIKSKTDESIHCYKIRKASHKNTDLNKINKIIILKKTQSALRQVGLWPYHQKKLVEFQVFFFIAILTSYILVQFITFLTTEYIIDNIINIFSLTSFLSLYLIPYNSFYINGDS